MSSPPNTGLHLDWCSFGAARYACRQWHYSRSMPASKTVKVGVWEDGRFVGAIVFARGANQHLGHAFGLTMYECVELARVALDAHKAPVSKMVSIAVRMLKRQSPGVRMVVSYSDCDQDHHGGIYQACGWAYLGQVQTDGGTPRYRVHGKVMHGRSVHARWGRGTQNIEWLRIHVDPWAERVYTRGKHKYALALDPAQRSAVEAMAQPYPKPDSVSRIPANRPDDHRGEGGAAPTLTLQQTG